MMVIKSPKEYYSIYLVEYSNTLEGDTYLSMSTFNLTKLLNTFKSRTFYHAKIMSTWVFG